METERFVYLSYSSSSVSFCFLTPHCCLLVSVVMMDIHRQSTLEMERLVEVRRAEEEAWYRQQELLMEAEQQRRTLIQREEQKLSDQRARYCTWLSLSFNYFALQGST